MSSQDAALAATATPAPVFSATATAAEILAGKQAPVEEKPVEETPAAPSRAKEFSVFAAREKKLIREREALKAKEAELAAKEAKFAELEKRLQQLEEGKKTYKTNPLKPLEDAGLSYKDVTDYVLNDNRPTPELQIKEVNDRLAAMEARREAEIKEWQKAELQRKQAEADAIIAQYKENIKTHVDEHEDKYEFLKLAQGYDLVYDIVEEYFNRHGEAPKLEDAAAKAEEYYEQELGKLSKAKKFATKLVVKPEASPEKAPVTGQSAKTLTNSVSPPTIPTLSASPKVEEERMRRALAALNAV
jgi:hypothetical protein